MRHAILVGLLIISGTVPERISLVNNQPVSNSPTLKVTVQANIIKVESTK